MTILTHVRNYTDSTLERSMSTLADASDRLFALPTGTKELAAGALTVVRRQTYAALGASDAVLATITKRGEEAPAEARQTAIRLRDTTRALLTQAKDVAGRTQDELVSVAGDLTERGSDAAKAARSIDLLAATDGVKDQVESRVGQLKDAFGKLADRGEQIAADLRHDPVLVRLISDTDTRVEKAANQVTSVAQKLRARTAAQVEREAAATTATPVRPTAPSKIPSHKTTVRNTPAGEAPIATTPTYRAAAAETATRKQAARKAAATRKAVAAEVTATRKAAADKAAATRAANAQARADAAENRKAAAVKAAATRKRTATKSAQSAPAKKTAARKTTAARSATK
ncbi:hypothetical protein M6D93_11085 [Jatrophihabitans telluris]|uniref:Uncharacterized protein n=1 Tax=Jatrophihabitans telluris TaxID=2038343 RepID=A0ABY4QVE7_9ACTN|nr:hypothetical protein [Jatrophihabitans telluris]UQX86851.1 hypothetical protein M6D93_11085 [Jatrophihabitans telluris]